MVRAKDYFLMVQKAEQKLKTLTARLRHFEELGLSISSQTSAVGGHQQGTSRVEIAAIGRVDAARDLDDEIARYRRIVTAAEQVIESIPQEKYRKLLYYRYLCGWSFKSISDELRYSDPNSVYRAHGWAMMKAQEILDKQEQEKVTRNDNNS